MRINPATGKLENVKRGGSSVSTKTVYAEQKAYQFTEYVFDTYLCFSEYVDAYGVIEAGKYVYVAETNQVFVKTESGYDEIVLHIGKINANWGYGWFETYDEMIAYSYPYETYFYVKETNLLYTGDENTLTAISEDDIFKGVSPYILGTDDADALIFSGRAENGDNFIFNQNLETGEFIESTLFVYCPISAFEKTVEITGSPRGAIVIASASKWNCDRFLPNSFSPTEFIYVYEAEKATVKQSQNVNLSNNGRWTVEPTESPLFFLRDSSFGAGWRLNSDDPTERGAILSEEQYKRLVNNWEGFEGNEMHLHNLDGFNGTLNDSTSTPIAEVRNGVIIQVYF